ncbi:nucleopolyhedrovirus P10 family protein [Streptomyces sp. NPDC051133]|uniref:nucleopolyhedrovirus P10 family protein n=1 Tax=Streptomyces sp. NPDC051133 TaxID=3155521 RepID=UPI0034151623
MTAEQWTRMVRHQVGLGRLVPLGGPGDGAWITEGAAGEVLGRAAAEGAPGVRLGTLRIAPADPEEVRESVVPAPPSALPPGALRVTADFAATAAEPLPTAAARLRRVLTTAATERLGLTVTEVDLRVTDLLETDEPAPAVRAPRPAPAREVTDPDEARVAEVVLAVPGVTGLTGSLGGLGRAVHVEERTDGAALPHRHVRVELTTGTGHRALDVARQVRAAVRDALADRPTVAVLVTWAG